MRKIIKTFVSGILLVTGLSAIPAMAQDCDRGCLQSFIDDYLDAVIDNDPAALPLGEFVRFTENGQQLELGDGLWQTMKSREGYDIYVSDVKAGVAAYMGVIGEDDRTPQGVVKAMIGLRLRIEQGQITEIEQFVVRNAEAAERISTMTPDPLLSATIPASERMDRRTLMVQANKYFTGMQRNDGKGDYPFTDDCNRIENGMQATNVPVPEGQQPVDPSTSVTYSAQWSCTEQFESGLLYFVNRIRDRRFVAVDEERGLVFTFVFFDHSGGEYRHAVTPSGREVTGGPAQPWTWQIVELFRLEDGDMRRIEAFLERSPYGMNSGWSSYEAGMSDRLQDDTF